MTSNKTPTDKVCAEKIFNSFVWFKDEKIYLSQEVPSIIALFLLLMIWLIGLVLVVESFINMKLSSGR